MNRLSFELAHVPAVPLTWHACLLQLCSAPFLWRRPKVSTSLKLLEDKEAKREELHRMLMKQKRVREASLYALEESTGVARVKRKRLGTVGRGAIRARPLACGM